MQRRPPAIANQSKLRNGGAGRRRVGAVAASCCLLLPAAPLEARGACAMRCSQECNRVTPGGQRDEMEPCRAAARRAAAAAGRGSLAPPAAGCGPSHDASTMNSSVGVDLVAIFV